MSADELLGRETELSVLNAELRRERLELKSAERDIEKTAITAPFRGVVQERHAQLGGYMRRGDPVVMLVDIDRFELEARIPDNLARDTDTLAEARFVSNGSTWPVRLARRFPLLESAERVVRARFTFPAEKPMIGTSGELRWESAAGLIPAALLVRREGKLGVFVAENDSARFIELPDAVEGRPARHTMPVTTRVITDGRQRLRDGDRIRLVER